MILSSLSYKPFSDRPLLHLICIVLFGLQTRRRPVWTIKSHILSIFGGEVRVKYYVYTGYKVLDSALCIVR